MSCNRGCNPCAPLSCGVGSCYRPQVNCWGPAYNVKCTQTIFCGCGVCGTQSGVNVSVKGIQGNGANDGSCTGSWELSIQGSGLSIISACNGNGNTNTAIAGLICSCPNNFTTTATLTAYASSGNPTIFNGCMSWCICGCNVCGSGTLTSGTTSANISVQGCCYSNCGTRTICINSIIVAAS